MIAAILFCLGVTATADVPKPQFRNTCAGIALTGWEFIEPQGFFGLATPTADGGLATRAFLEALAKPNSIVQKYCDLLQKQYKTTYQLGPLKELILLCQADTVTSDSYHPVPDQVLVECHLAYNHSFVRSPDFFDIRRYSIAQSYALRYTVNCENRHDLIDDPAVRRGLYLKAFEQLAQDEVEREERGLWINVEPYHSRYKTR
jgi:hypothetical protein